MAKIIAKKQIEDMANDLIKVQPMPSDCIKKLHDVSMTKETLINEGYSPVSSIGLMWIKNEN